MPGFESGATDTDDLFAEEDQSEEPETQDQDSADEASEPDSPGDQEAQETRSERSLTTSSRSRDSVSSTHSQPVRLEDLDLLSQPTTKQLTEALKGEEYHEAHPEGGVLFGTWRDGTRHGRNRITYETQEQTEDLIEEAQHEFKTEFGFPIKKTDLREIALVIGLTHLDEVREVAENWGLQYD